MLDRFGSSAALAMVHAVGRLVALQQTFKASVVSGSSVPEAEVLSLAQQLPQFAALT